MKTRISPHFFLFLEALEGHLVVAKESLGHLVVAKESLGCFAAERACMAENRAQECERMDDTVEGMGPARNGRMVVGGVVCCQRAALVA